LAKKNNIKKKHSSVYLPAPVESFQCLSFYFLENLLRVLFRIEVVDQRSRHVTVNPCLLVILLCEQKATFRTADYTE